MVAQANSGNSGQVNFRRALKGLGFSRAVKTASNQAFSVFVRTTLSLDVARRELRKSAPEGRLPIARRFSAGERGNTEQVPEGRLKFSGTLFSP